MKTFKIIFIPVVFVVTMFSSNFARAEGVLNRMLEQAKNLAVQAIDSTASDMLQSPDVRSDVIQFYHFHRNELKNEIQDSPIVLASKEQVFAWVDGKKEFAKAHTKNEMKADILVSSELNADSNIESLVRTLLHEAGHHLGVKDENEFIPLPAGEKLFLDRLASAILEQAKQNLIFNKALTSVIVPMAENYTEAKIISPTIKVGDQGFISIESNFENANAYCKAAGYRSAISANGEFSYVPGVPGSIAMIKTIKPGAKQSYSEIEDPGLFLEFYRFDQNAYAGSIKMIKVTCTDNLNYSSPFKLYQNGVLK